MFEKTFEGIIRIIVRPCISATQNCCSWIFLQINNALLQGACIMTKMQRASSSITVRIMFLVVPRGLFSLVIWLFHVKRSAPGDNLKNTHRRYLSSSLRMWIIPCALVRRATKKHNDVGMVIKFPCGKISVFVFRSSTRIIAFPKICKIFQISRLSLFNLNVVMK